MRKLGLGLAVLGSLAVTAEADNFHAVLSTSGVMASFDGVTSDGCVHTSGIFYTGESSEGPFAFVLASSTDSCAAGGPVSGTHIGAGNISYTSNGLGAATVSGTIDAWDYQAQLANLTFEFSLAFQGTGTASVQETHGDYVSPGGDVLLSFSSSRSRAAIVSGAMTVDGGSVTLSNAILGSGTSGDVSIAR